MEILGVLLAFVGFALGIYEIINTLRGKENKRVLCGVAIAYLGYGVCYSVSQKDLRHLGVAFLFGLIFYAIRVMCVLLRMAAKREKRSLKNDLINTIVTIAISLASLIVAIAALRVAKQSIEVGLYPMRKEVMKKFCEEKYDDIFFDVAALFGSKISDDFMVMGMYHDRYQEYVKICKEYIGYIKRDKPEVYNECVEQFQNIPLKDDDKEGQLEIFRLCAYYRPKIKNKLDNKLLNYEEIVDNIIRYNRKYLECRLQVSISMQNRLNKSISFGFGNWYQRNLKHYIKPIFRKNKNVAYWWIEKSSK